MTAPGLSGVGDHDLAALAGALDRGSIRAPITPASLQANGLAHLVEPLGPYLALDAVALRAVVGAVQAERHHRKAPRLTLVWTGDEPGPSHARHTRVLLPEIVDRAREHVLIAGYAIDAGAEAMFERLHERMAKHGVTVDLFVDVGQLEERLEQTARRRQLDWAALAAPLRATGDPAARGRAVVALFLRMLWPSREPRPTIYFDPRTADKSSGVSMHAKCVVRDHEYTLITSANFTSRGQKRNVEAGVAIEDRPFAASVERQWWNLVDGGVVIPT